MSESVVDVENMLNARRRRCRRDPSSMPDAEAKDGIIETSVKGASFCAVANIYLCAGMRDSEARQRVVVQ